MPIIARNNRPAPETDAFEQGTQARRSPASTPPLASESIPEPGTTVAFIVFAFGTLLIWKRGPLSDLP